MIVCPVIVVMKTQHTWWSKPDENFKDELVNSTGVRFAIYTEFNDKIFLILVPTPILLQPNWLTSYLPTKTIRSDLTSIGYCIILFVSWNPFDVHLLL